WISPEASPRRPWPSTTRRPAGSNASWMGRPMSLTTSSAVAPAAVTTPGTGSVRAWRGVASAMSATPSSAATGADLDSPKRPVLALRRTGRPKPRQLTPPQGVGLMINRLSLALVVALAVAFGVPASAQQPTADTKAPKGVKARNLVTSLGGFTATVNAPLLITGQTIELEPGGHTGRQQYRVPTYVYVIEGILTTQYDS